METPKRILPIIVFAQFACTSLWFAGNAVVGGLVTDFNLSEKVLADITSAVQFGFISGTLLFAVLSIADRFSPSFVFLVCAILGALCNSLIIWEGNTLASLLFFRFLTGFFLAGIYPVGMKIAADYYEKGLGKSLGFLVGALVVGTAFPHLLKTLATDFPWRYVILLSSAFAIGGGVAMAFLVPDGPFRKPSAQLDFTAIFKIFQSKPFRSAAFGYFGHMWELYAFWAFVPVMLTSYAAVHATTFPIALLSFCIIGMGGIACAVGGYLSQRLSAQKVAFGALLSSCLCCLVSPFFIWQSSPVVFVGFLLFWGWVVIADSPLFSTLVAQNAIPEVKGTALTIVNSIGFFITIFSIQLLYVLTELVAPTLPYLALALGPILGLIALKGGKHPD